MGFWDALGMIAELASWETTLKEDGVAMLRVKIRNYLRRSSAEDRREVEKKLGGMRYMASDLERMKLISTLYDVYCDEAARI
jgi:hypothetical protein